MGWTLFTACGFVLVLALSFRKSNQPRPEDDPSVSEILQSIKAIIDEEKKPPQE